MNEPALLANRTAGPISSSILPSLRARICAMRASPVGLSEKCVVQFRLEPPRCQSVDANPVRHQIDRHRARELDDCALGRAVAGQARLHAQTQDRCDIDDRSFAACGDQSAGSRLADVPHTAEIRVHDGVAIGRVDLQEILCVADAGIAHDDIDGAERLLRQIEGALDAIHIRHIGLSSDGGAAVPLDLADQIIEPVRPASDGNDPRARCGQSSG